MRAPIGPRRFFTVRYWTPVRVFLLTAFVFGVPLVFVSPPLTTPDEGRHMARIYTISAGSLRLPADARVPESLVELNQRMTRLWPPLRPRKQRRRETLRPFWDQPLNPAAQVPVRNLATYGPLAYAPQALGFVLGRAVEAPPIGLVYLGRLANLFTWALVVAAALAITPLRRWAFAALALLPMSLFLAASLSADAPTNALALLFVAAVLRAGFGPHDGVRPGDVALLCVAAALFGLTKGGYWPLAGVALLIPGARFRGARHRWFVMAAVASAALVPSGLWFAEAQTTGYAEAGKGADWVGQLEFIGSNPLRYAGIFFDSWLETGRAYVTTFLGVLGRLDVVLPAWLYGSLAVALVTLPVLEARDPEALVPARRIGLLALFALSTGAVFTMIYLAGNEVGAPLIRGVQGRYLWPLAPLLLLAVPARGRSPEEERGEFLAAFVAGVSIASLVSLRALWVRYYF